MGIYNGKISSSQTGPVWATGLAYSVNDLAVQSSKLYICLIAHTSGVFATDLAALKWKEIGASLPLVGIPDVQIYSPDNSLASSGLVEIKSGAATGGSSGNSGTLSLKTGNITTTNATSLSGSVTVSSGTATAAVGQRSGAVSLSSGASNTTSLASGSVSLVSGNNAGTFGTSGDAVIQTGSTVRGLSGKINLLTGPVSGASGDSGPVEIFTGSANAGSTGAITVASGNTTTTNLPTGIVTVKSGNTTTSNGISGEVSVRSGTSSGTNGSTGIVTVGSGDVSSTSTSGTTKIVSGSSTGDGLTGFINIATGDLGGTASGLVSGGIEVKTGIANIATGQRSGNIQIISGDTNHDTLASGFASLGTGANSSASGRTGDVYITTGDLTSTGSTGDISIYTGNNITGPGGEISLSPGTSGGGVVKAVRIIAPIATTPNDFTGSGSNADISNVMGVVRMTNASLVSVQNIAAGVPGQILVLLNITGVTVVLKDTSAALGVAANRIITGTGTDYSIPDLKSVYIFYDGTAARWRVFSSPSPDSNPVGSVLNYAGSTAPFGYLFCDGARVSRTTYADLFSVIGVTNGSGDGSTTFNLPDLRWGFVRGRGANISVTGTGTASSNQATFTAHGFNRSGVKVRLSSGTLSGLSTATDYWTIYVDANTLSFATTKANAIAGTVLAISGANSAVIVQYEDPDVAARTANAPGGNTGASAGSYQTNDVQAHTHPITTTLGGGGFAGSNGITGAQTPSGSGSQATDLSTGKETRPNNISMNYIIRY